MPIESLLVPIESMIHTDFPFGTGNFYLTHWKYMMPYKWPMKNREALFMTLEIIGHPFCDLENISTHIISVCDIEFYWNPSQK